MLACLVAQEFVSKEVRPLSPRRLRVGLGNMITSAKPVLVHLGDMVATRVDDESSFQNDPSCSAVDLCSIVTEAAPYPAWRGPW